MKFNAYNFLLSVPLSDRVIVQDNLMESAEEPYLFMVERMYFLQYFT